MVPSATGFASGDPLADWIVLWTRVTVDGRDAVPVRWRVSRSSDLGDAVAEGQATAAGEDDFTVKVDVRNLEGRDRPAEDGERPVATIESRDRSLLGEDQRRWLRDELRAPAAWRVLGNQVMMAPLRVLTLPGPLRRFLPGTVAGGAGINAGQWDGYPGERRDLFEFVERAGVKDLVVLTGDLHSSWASELTLDPTQPSGTVGVEFVTPSITSRSFAEEVAPPVPGARAVLRRVVRCQNPQVRFFDLERHGYVVVDVDRDRVRAEWWHVDGVTDPAAGETPAARWMVPRGDPRLIEDGPTGG